MTNLNNMLRFLPSQGFTIQPAKDVYKDNISAPIHLRDLVMGAIEKAFFDVVSVPSLSSLFMFARSFRYRTIKSKRIV